MAYQCPVGCGGAVLFTGPEVWIAPDGDAVELAAGECGRCHSEVKVRLSRSAIDIAQTRLSASGTMRAMFTEHGRQEPDVASMADAACTCGEVWQGTGPRPPCAVHEVADASETSQ